MTRLFDTGIFDSGIFKTDEPAANGIFSVPPFDTGIFDHPVATGTGTFDTGIFDRNIYDNILGPIRARPPQVFGGGAGQSREPAKLILSWLPPKKKKPRDEEKVAVVEDAIEQALEAAPIAPPINPQEIELAARLLLAEYSLAELRRIKYADTLLERIQTVMAEMDDEDVLLLAA